MGAERKMEACERGIEANRGGGASERREARRRICWSVAGRVPPCGVPGAAAVVVAALLISGANGFMPSAPLQV